MWLPKDTFDVSVGLLPYVQCSIKFGSAVSIQVRVPPLLIILPWLVTELLPNSYAAEDVLRAGVNLLTRNESRSTFHCLTF